MESWLQGAVALVTGASRGIGYHTARALLEAGATVYACSRHIEPLERSEASHERLVALRCDVRSIKQVRAMMARIERDHGRLDLLVNNASILGAKGPLQGLDPEAWRETIDINLNGAFFIAQAALPLLAQRASRSPAKIIHLSSSVGREARAEWGAYSISKIGLEGLSQLITEERDPDQLISVTLNPGGTATAMRREAYPEEDPSELPDAERIASTIVLLARALTAEQAGAQFSSRALFEAAAAEVRPEASALPRDDL